MSKLKTSKYYNLSKNESTYTHSKNLFGWFSFDESIVGKHSVSSLVPPGSNPVVGVNAPSTLTGSFVGQGSGGFTIQKEITSAQIETPSFLNGLQYLRKASVTISERNQLPPYLDGFEISNFDIGDANRISTSTFSFIFKFLQLGPDQRHGADVQVEIATISDQSDNKGRIGLFLDYDGGTGGIPGIAIKMYADDPAISDQWVCNIPTVNNKSVPEQLREWCRLDLVINDPQWALLKAKSANWLRDGHAKIYFNGRDITFGATGTNNITGQNVEATAMIRKVLVGGLGAGITGVTSRQAMQIGEVSFWNTALPASEINWLYQRQIGQGPGNPTSTLSNPLPGGRVGDCGECDHDAYPTIKRTTDSRRLGLLTPHFDDTASMTVPLSRSMGYTAAGLAADLKGHHNKINYPTLLQSGAIASSAVGNIIKTPNRLPTIFTTASLQAQRGYSNVIASYPNCSASKDFSDSYKPFDDSKFRVDLAIHTGSLHNILPNFSSHLGDRFVIDIDITPKAGKTISVVTGNMGETYGGYGFTNKSDPDKTGLVYFNFKTMLFESMGSQNSETGFVNNWNLPGEVSSSYNFYYHQVPGSPNPGDRSGTSYSNDMLPDVAFSGEWDSVRASIPGMGAQRGRQGAFNKKFSHSIYYEDLERVPRIFQPFSSIASHRNTFNHTRFEQAPPASSNFNAFEYYGGRIIFQLNPSSSAETWHDEFLKLDGLRGGVAPNLIRESFNADAGRTNLMGFGGQLATDAGEWFIYDNDIAGQSFIPGPVGVSFNQPHELKLISASIVWNQKANTDLATVSVMNDEWTRLFKTMGRPVAYTNWCRNSIFHASSSQLLKMSDYINGPFLLEGFEVQQKVRASRYQKPTAFMTQLGTWATASVNADHNAWYAAEYSNQNNHIDNLTYFLLRQETPFKASGSLNDRSQSSIRELISWSNHVFASPFVGWDIQDSLTPQLKSPTGVANQTLFVPVCGARVSRIFEVKEDVVKKHVPAVDSFQYYTPDTDELQAPHKIRGGQEGVFFGKSNRTDDKGMPAIGDLKEGSQPQERWVTASADINFIAPVKTCTPYAQHMTPILPNHVGWWTYDVDSNAPYGQSGGPNATGYIGLTGNRNFFQQGNIPRMVPRSTLMCMGTYWPGGTRTSANMPRQPESAFTFVSQSFSIRKKYDKFSHPLSFVMTGSQGPHPPRYADKPAEIISETWEMSERTVTTTGAGKTSIKAGGQVKIPNRWNNSGGAHGQGGEGYSPSYLMANNNYDYMPDHNMGRAGAPQYYEWDISGSMTSESAYILFPSDELIFGAQWSPADAVHRSFKAIKEGTRAASYRGASPGTGNVPDFEPEAEENAGSLRFSHSMRAAGIVTAQQRVEQSYRYAGYSESNDLVMVASSSCYIDSSTSKLRLYGVLLKNQVQKQHSLPQQLTTLCVHEVIGNEPILDTYDIGSTDLLASSRSSQFVSGTINQNSMYVLGSDNKSAFPPAATGYSGYSDKDGTSDSIRGRGVRRSWSNQNLHDIGKVNRVLVAEDISEFYYDSIAPDINEMFIADGVSAIQGKEVSGFMGSNFVAYPTIAETNKRFTNHYPISLQAASDQLIHADETTHASNRMFGRSFPFEPRYANIQRKFTQTARPAYGWNDTGGANDILTIFQVYSGSTDGGRISGTGAWGFNTADNGGSNVGSFTFRGTTTGMSSILAEPAVKKVTQKIDKRQSRHGGTRPGSYLTAGGVPKKYPFSYRMSREAVVPEYFPEGEYQAICGTGGGWKNADPITFINNNWNTTGSNGNNLTGFFGVGNNHYGVLDWSYLYQVVDETVPIVHTWKLLAQKPRGYRYGLMSAKPRKTTAVFRRNSYGQFRDMLEQRQSCRAYVIDPPDIAVDRLSQGKRIRTGEVIGLTVLGKFRTQVFTEPAKVGLDAKTEPVNTNSSNLNKFATSSLPYFDGVSTNRDAPPATTEVIVT